MNMQIRVPDLQEPIRWLDPYPRRASTVVRDFVVIVLTIATLGVALKIILEIWP